MDGDINWNPKIYRYKGEFLHQDDFEQYSHVHTLLNPTVSTDGNKVAEPAQILPEYRERVEEIRRKWDSKQQEEKRNEKDVLDLKQKVEEKREQKLWVAGFKRPQPYPRRSSWDEKQQRFVVDQLMLFSATGIPTHPPPAQARTVHELMMMLEGMKEEQEEFMNFVREVNTSQLNRYKHFAGSAKGYFQKYIQHKYRLVERTYPCFYTEIGMLPLAPPCGATPNFYCVGQPLELGEIPVCVIPTMAYPTHVMKQSNVLGVLFPYSDHYPRIPNTGGSGRLPPRDGSYLYKDPVSSDPNVVRLSAALDFSVVLSPSVLKMLMDNHAPQWDKPWDIPVKVEELPCRQKGRTRRVVFLDKPLPPRALDAIEKNQRVHKRTVRLLVCKRKTEANIDYTNWEETNKPRFRDFRQQKWQKEGQKWPKKKKKRSAGSKETQGPGTENGSEPEKKKPRPEENTSTADNPAAADSAQNITNSDEASDSDDNLVIDTEGDVNISVDTAHESSLTKDNADAVGGELADSDDGQSDESVDLDQLEVSGAVKEYEIAPSERTKGPEALESNGDLLKKAKEYAASRKSNKGDVSTQCATGSASDFPHNPLECQARQDSDGENSLTIDAEPVFGPESSSDVMLTPASDPTPTTTSSQLDSSIPRPITVPESSASSSGDQAKGSVTSGVEVANAALCTDTSGKESVSKTVPGRAQGVSGTHSDTESGFLRPPPGLNVNYRVWQLGSTQMLIRCTTHGMRENPVVGGLVRYTVHPKLAYQPAYGVEVMTRPEVIRQWLDCAVRPDSRVLRVHVDPVSQMVLTAEEKTLKQLTEEFVKYNTQFRPQYGLQVVEGILRGLTGLPPGRYLLSHDARSGAFVRLLRATDAAPPGGVDLRKSFRGPPREAPLSTPPWLPIDTSVLTSHSVRYGRVPGLFDYKLDPGVVGWKVFWERMGKKGLKRSSAKRAKNRKRKKEEADKAAAAEAVANTRSIVKHLKPTAGEELDSD